MYKIYDVGKAQKQIWNYQNLGYYESQTSHWERWIPDEGKINFHVGKAFAAKNKDPG